MNEQQFITQLNENGLEISTQQLEQFEIYYEFLIEYNKQVNLTAITDKKEVYQKHFFDSLLFMFHKSDFKTLCDVGAGAGFPSIPICIMYPHIQATIVEPLGKRVKFLNQLVSKLKLNNVTIQQKRSEDFASEKREFFDVVSARAVANLTMLSELCLPLVRKNGYFVALKGSKGEQEYQEAKYAINCLGGKLEYLQEFSYNNEEKRMNFFIRKEKNTPKQYPRHFSKIKKLPLQKRG